MKELKNIKQDFPILNNLSNGKPLVYLDSAATTQKPQIVLDEIIKFYSSTNSNIHRGVHNLSLQASEAYEQARNKVKNFINAKKESEIIFTHGATESINLLAHSFGLEFIREGDEIIISEMEHHSNLIPWQVMCQQKQALLKIIPLDDKGELKTKTLTKLISEKTKLISLTYVSNVLGTINPIRKIIKLAHENNIPVMIDGAQAIQHLPIDVQELDCDFFVFSGHKIYAETGIGVLYGKEEWLEKLPPYQYGGGMIDSVSFENTVITKLPLKFEAGTTNYAAAISLGVAIDYLQNIGLLKIKAYENKLLEQTAKRLQEIAGVIIYGNATQRCGALAFNLVGIHPYDVGIILDQMGIAIRTGTHCAQPTMEHFGIESCLRVSFGIYNDNDDIEALIQGILQAQKMLQA